MQMQTGQQTWMTEIYNMLLYLFGSESNFIVFKKQSTISRSSTEAEYRSVASATVEIIWIKSLISELKIKVHNKATMWCDNMSTIALTANSALHSRTKHMKLHIFLSEKK